MSRKTDTSRDLEEIRAALRVRLPELRERYGVRTLGVFGSRVQGRGRPGSDLDLLVEFDDRPLTLFQFIELENYLGDLLGMKVDLVEKNALKPVIGKRILDQVVSI